jgi:hypothetical protein
MSLSENTILGVIRERVRKDGYFQLDKSFVENSLFTGSTIQNISDLRRWAQMSNLIFEEEQSLFIFYRK